MSKEQKLASIIKSLTNFDALLHLMDEIATIESVAAKYGVQRDSADEFSEKIDELIYDVEKRTKSIRAVQQHAPQNYLILKS